MPHIIRSGMPKGVEYRDHEAPFSPRPVPSIHDLVVSGDNPMPASFCTGVLSSGVRDTRQRMDRLQQSPKIVRFHQHRHVCLQIVETGEVGVP